MMLLRLPGISLYQDHPDNRIAVANRMWDTMKEIGVEFTTLHYNALLRVKIENGDKFSVPDMLAEMESNPLAPPNRMTYQLFIHRYCEDGDIDGARKIFEFLKSQGMAVNEFAFNFMVKGYMTVGDEEGALNIMENMKNYGAVPTNYTYAALMSGYAETGNIDKIKEVFQTSKENFAAVRPHSLLDMYFIMCQKGFKDESDQLLSLVAREYGTSYNLDAMKSIYRLAAYGMEEEAYRVLKIMNKEGPMDRYLLQFMKALVVSKASAETVLEYYEKLNSEYGSDPVSIIELAEWSLIHKKTELSLKLFDLMNERGLPVRNHFFWPLAKQTSDKGSTDELYNVMRSIVKYVGSSELNQKTTFNYTFKTLFDRGEKIEDIISKLEEFGSEKVDIDVFRIMWLMGQGRLEEALDIPSTLPNASIDLYCKFLITGLLKKESIDLDILAKFLEALPQRNTFHNALYGNLLRGLAWKVDRAVLHNILDVYAEKKIQIRESDASQIIKTLDLADPDSIETIQKLESLILDIGNADKILDRAKFRKDNVQRKSLDQHSIEYLTEKLETTTDSDKRNALAVTLLYKHHNARDYDSALKYKTMLESSPSYACQVHVNECFGVMALDGQEANLQEALMYLNTIETQDSGFVAYRLLNSIALHHLTNNRPDDALALYRDRSQAIKHTVEKTGFPQYMRTGSIELLSKAADHSLATLDGILNILVDCGCLDPQQTRDKGILRGIMAKCIETDVLDSDGVLSLYKHLAEKYRVPCCVQKTMTYFIEKNDAKRLQEVVDVTASLVPQHTVMSVLGVAFLKAGQIHSAKAIFSKPDMKIDTQYIVNTCIQLTSSKQGETLTHLVNLMKDRDGISRGGQLFFLMRYHGEQGDYKAALDVLSTFEQEDVRCVPRYLSYLSDLLKKHDQPVPFTVPEVYRSEQVEPIMQKPSLVTQKPRTQQQKPRTQQQMLRWNKVKDPVFSDFLSRPLTSVENEAVLAISNKKWDTFLNIFRSEFLNKELDRDFCVAAGNLLYAKCYEDDQNTSPVVDYMNSLSESNETDTMMAIKERVYDPKAILIEGLISSGHIEKVYSWLREDPKRVVHIRYQDLSHMLEVDPQCLSQLESIWESDSDNLSKNRMGALSFILHNITQGNWDKAEELIEKYKLSRRFAYNPLVMSIVTSKQVGQDTLQKLMELLGRLSTRRLPHYFYTVMIGYRCDEGDWQGGLKYYKECITMQERHDLLNRSPEAKQLAQLLTTHSQPVPLNIQVSDLESPDSSDSSSSSSDSSDSSDDEKSTRQTRVSH